jgi:hypothetical protein
MDESNSHDPRELSPRKKAVAEEVLRRPYQAKEGGRLRKYAWLPLIAVLGLARVTMRRFRGRKQIDG